MFDIKIMNGLILDGTGNAWTKLDIGIVNDTITEIGELANLPSKKTIDADGQIVAPGFIDPHVHSDLLCLKPEIHKIKVLQGVTTELFGQDGISVAPVSAETKPLWQKQLKGLNGDIGDWPWETIDEYLGFLEASDLAGNNLYLFPHGAARTLVMGFEGRKATKEEMIEMRKIVEKGMKEGAVGVSSGLVYPPNLYSNKEELIEICKGAVKYGGCFVVHIRNESNHSLEALDEVIDVARITGIRLQVSHFKVAGKLNRDKYKQALRKMEEARKEGIEVTFDQYPYTAGSTMLTAILPPWMHEGGTERLLERLKDEKVRNQIKEDFLHNDAFENLVRNCGWENIIIASVATEKNKNLENKNMLEVAQIRNGSPEDIAFDILIEEEANATMIIHLAHEDDVKYAMQHPLQMVGSDGIFGGKAHPRLYGTYPRVLGKYVREEGVLTLPEAIRRMTAAPAQLLRLEDRGLLKKGYKADIVIFDPDTVKDCSTYKEPLQEPIGIHYVLVNGQVAVEDGQFTGATAGAVIRGKGTKSTK